MSSADASSCRSEASAAATASASPSCRAERNRWRAFDADSLPSEEPSAARSRANEASARVCVVGALCGKRRTAASAWPSTICAIDAKQSAMHVTDGVFSSGCCRDPAARAEAKRRVLFVASESREHRKGRIPEPPFGRIHDAVVQRDQDPIAFRKFAVPTQTRCQGDTAIEFVAKTRMQRHLRFDGQRSLFAASFNLEDVLCAKRVRSMTPISRALCGPTPFVARAIMPQRDRRACRPPYRRECFAHR